MEAIPSHTLLPCRPVRGMPSRSVHRVMGSVPHNPAQPNPPRMGRRPQKQPSRRGESSLVPVPAHHLGANPSMRRLWEARWLPLGSNGQTSLGPQHCLAALLDLCDHAGRPGRRSNCTVQNPPCSLAKSLQGSNTFHPALLSFNPCDKVPGVT